MSGSDVALIIIRPAATLSGQSGASSAVCVTQKASDQLSWNLDGGETKKSYQVPPFGDRSAKKSGPRRFETVMSVGKRHKGESAKLREKGRVRQKGRGRQRKCEGGWKGASGSEKASK